MSKRVSPTVIGAFVVASFAILVVALIVVGSGRIFTRPIRFICMFQGNLNGLKIGAPVKVRGVQIGTVAAIELRLLPSQGRILPTIRGLRLPVIIDLDRSQLLARGGTGEALETAGFDKLIKEGFRAQLATESLLTGLLYIDLDVHPNTPLKFVLEPNGPIPGDPDRSDRSRTASGAADKSPGQIRENRLSGAGRSRSPTLPTRSRLSPARRNSRPRWSRSRGRWRI